MFYGYRKDKKSNDSLYRRIREKLESDLSQAKFSNNWKEKQKISLQIHWLDTIKEIESRDMLGQKKEESESEVLSDLTEEELRFPSKWELDNIYHFPFITGIVGKFGQTLANNKFKGVFKPNSILPFPKESIKKAIHYLFDYLNYDKPLYEIKDKAGYADNLNNLKISLYMYFVEGDESQLPSEGVNNVLIGKKLLANQTEPSEIEELDLIDWRSESQWIRASVHHTQKEDFDFAEKCLNKALEINPLSQKARDHFGLNYICKAEHFEENGDEIKAKEFRDLAKEYGVTAENLKEKFDLGED